MRQYDQRKVFAESLRQSSPVQPVDISVLGYVGGGGGEDDNNNNNNKNNNNNSNNNKEDDDGTFFGDVSSGEEMDHVSGKNNNLTQRGEVPNFFFRRRKLENLTETSARILIVLRLF